ncbi:hypothetical protein CDAR_209961 [Caerostris darwini]|uniref:Uncharacterized protein n=1 Tax=Caerostris darwini TaxID=1538125 RepID=A0AAV4QI81_9ARAC|nr:hypothetical protein CDAR_209961 [Caerostris darwini]
MHGVVHPRRPPFQNVQCTPIKRDFNEVNRGMDYFGVARSWRGWCGGYPRNNSNNIGLQSLRRQGDVGVEPKCDFQWMTLAGRTPPSTPDSVLDHYAPQHRIIRARSSPALWSVMRLHK